VKARSQCGGGFYESKEIHLQVKDDSFEALLMVVHDLHKLEARPPNSPLLFGPRRPTPQCMPSVDIWLRISKFSSPFVVFGEFQNTPSNESVLGMAFVSSLSIAGNPCFQCQMIQLGVAHARG